VAKNGHTADLVRTEFNGTFCSACLLSLRQRRHKLELRNYYYYYYYYNYYYKSTDYSDASLKLQGHFTYQI